jgi:cation-transporting ATPase G
MTGSQVAQLDDDDDDDRPWWRSPSVLIPIGSGVAFAAGLVCEWTGADLAALVLFWIGLLLGASTFVPGALRKLFTRGKLGIGLLMTISAVGAVILGYVEEAAALAFLYSIAEALEDKAMDRARAGLRALLKLVPETALVKLSLSRGHPMREAIYLAMTQIRFVPIATESPVRPRWLCGKQH